MDPAKFKEDCVNQSMKHLTTNFERVPADFNKLIQEFAKPHLESFNFMLKEGLMKATQDIPPMEFALPSGAHVMLALKDALIGVPYVTATKVYTKDMRLFPSECRLKGTTYCAKLHVALTWSVDGHMQPTIEKDIGDIPIMVKSSACHLSKMTPKELIKHHEEPEEFGGYFIVNGNEKIIRMLVMQRRNYPLVMTRPSWRQRGKLFSEYGVSVRSVKADQSACSMVLHYLTNGTAKLMFSYRKEMFFVPVILLLKALCNYTDYEIYQELVKGKEDVSYYKGCIAVMLRQVQDEGLYNQAQILDYIGVRFRNKLFLPEWYTNQQIAEFLLLKCICIHLESNRDKFNFLVYMIKKLYTAVAGECALESPDNPMNHELLLGGHLYLMVLKEKLELWLVTLRQAILQNARTSGTAYKLTSSNLNQALRKTIDLSRPMEYLLATGNVVTKSGLSLLQTSGMTIVADKLNYLRYISHFRCAHRGAFFTQMRTTSARKLLPESWGFICPVHTPDGTPCGLLNHLSESCKVITMQSPVAKLPKLLCSLGLIPHDCPASAAYKECYVVLLDGRVLGYIPKEEGQLFTNKLRHLKVMNPEMVPQYLEICLVPFTNNPSQYPGLYLFTTPARMMRPVLNLSCNAVEYIGVFEQVYLNVSVIPKEIYPGITTHMELKENNMLSFLANLIPLSDFNQSPRNMYQCQMGKQTMGTPTHVLKFRTDNKLYRIITPQSPLFRPLAYDKYDIDNYPLGTNAIVAVISHTGYDMEDAMILNKSSFERGFAHGVVYKHVFVDLCERKRTSTEYFGRLEDSISSNGSLGPDGFPPIGKLLSHGDPYYSVVDAETGNEKVHRYSSLEDAYIQDILAIGGDSNSYEFQKVCFRLRIPRNPIIGDKFASRHGQKGICSQKWPLVDMPFTESGMTPDIIFNPHGFPSRMTIGMMVESMAGKSAALHGLVHDASPFKFSEGDSATDYFGRLLEAAGYNYYGTERMYSGVDGRELNADIFFGVVYYQRLRHMVADKYQVRTTGPVDILTHQPVKGRKRAGGIRFGEMERDSLLAHGVSFLLQDRLFNCSDRSLDYVCTNCGGLLSPILNAKNSSIQDAHGWTCLLCETGDNIQLIALPFVFRYLAAELAAVNIRVILDIVAPK